MKVQSDMPVKNQILTSVVLIQQKAEHEMGLLLRIVAWRGILGVSRALCSLGERIGEAGCGSDCRGPLVPLVKGKREMSMGLGGCLCGHGGLLHQLKLDGL